MCAICGIVKFNGIDQDDVQQLLRMRERMAHRGPDDAGVYHDPDVVLGSRRLSIIDLPTGDQPLANEDQTVWALLNGEIYNFVELRKELEAKGHRFRTQSDTEVLVHLYEEEQEEFLKKLRGMFAIALWDRTRRRLLLARDRLGIKPLYYARQGQTLLFSSELKGLLRHPAIDPQLDLVSLDAYLQLDYVPSPRSILQGVSKLPPGSLLLVDSSGERLSRFWELPSDAPETSIGFQEAQEKLKPLIEESVRLHLRSDVPVGILLSGGMDSSTIAAFALRQPHPPIAAFTVSFEESSFDETDYAKRVASFLGIRHVAQRLRAADALSILPEAIEKCDEPLGDSSILPSWCLSALARSEVVVALSGEGGDELFGGYPTYAAHRVAEWYRKLPVIFREKAAQVFARRLPVSHRNFSMDFVANRFLRGASFPVVERHRAWMGSFDSLQRKQLWLPEIHQQLWNGSGEKSFDSSGGMGRVSADPADVAMRLDLKSYLPDDLLVKVDRMSMAHGLEVRVPFLDPPIVDFALNLPASFKIRGLQTKVLLRQAMRGSLPAQILKRPKKGFGMPIASWLCDGLRPMLTDLLGHERLHRQGRWDVRYIDQICDEHFRRIRNHGKLLWTLLVFELWVEKHVENALEPRN